MPIYEYACQKCGNVVEVFQKVGDKAPAKCAKCGGKLARVLSQTSFQLKGGGWYKDLYSSVKPGGEGDSSADSATKTDDKPSAAAAPKETPKPAAKPEKTEAKASKAPPKSKKKARP